MTQHLKLVEVTVEGKTGFLVSPHPSCWDPAPITDDPTKACNFNETWQPYVNGGLKVKHDLQQTLDSLVHPQDEMFAKSGLRIDDLPHVVELEVSVSWIETDRRLGRGPHRAPAQG